MWVYITMGIIGGIIALGCPEIIKVIGLIFVIVRTILCFTIIEAAIGILVIIIGEIMLFK